LEKTTVGGGGCIRHDGPIERPFLSSHAFQANTYCHWRCPFSDREFRSLERAWKRQVTPFPFALFLPYQGFHQFLRLGELLQEAIYLFHTRAAAARDTLAPTAVNDGMIVALVRRHRTDNGFHLLQTTLIDRGQLSGFESWDHGQNVFERAHLFNLLQLGAKILQGEAGLAHFLFERCRSLL